MNQLVAANVYAPLSRVGIEYGYAVANLLGGVVHKVAVLGNGVTLRNYHEEVGLMRSFTEEILGNTTGVVVVYSTRPLMLAEFINREAGKKMIKPPALGHGNAVMIDGNAGGVEFFRVEK